MNNASSLPKIIETLEELILASTGADPFQEILKLIYIKLYVEKKDLNLSDHRDIFEKAKKEWPGMFTVNERIEIPQEHLILCLNILDKIKIYGTDLSIIDITFERLLPKTAKSSRGQFFTPRHIIDEIIKMINPKKDESILDPACGSGGFLLHASQYTQTSKNIFGIDYDSSMHKIAKTMLLIAGFEDAKIINANSLADLSSFSGQQFDVIMTNPPFGGEVRDKKILENYTLAKNERGQPRAYTERHVLFLEQIIKLLTPGGRAAIIVPQGILNNTNLNYLRLWLYTKTRILGVISLDTNTFKPYTNVKTSILILQKWDGLPLNDYPLFMAVSKKCGKNLSGNLLFKTGGKKSVIDSDLPEISQKFNNFLTRHNLIKS